MSVKQLPSPELLRQLIRYEPDTGKLYWKERSQNLFKRKADCKAWNKRYAGHDALSSVDSCGYRRGFIMGNMMLAHVAAYAVHHGEYPNNVDHINGNRSDNRIKNLRSVTKRENSLNRGLNSNNTSGHTGVIWLKHRHKWQAKIKIHGKQISLGHYQDKSEAITARKKAEAKYGFHPNHGSKRQ